MAPSGLIDPHSTEFPWLYREAVRSTRRLEPGEGLEKKRSPTDHSESPDPYRVTSEWKV